MQKPHSRQLAVFFPTQSRCLTLHCPHKSRRIAGCVHFRCNASEVATRRESERCAARTRRRRRRVARSLLQRRPHQQQLRPHQQPTQTRCAARPALRTGPLTGCPPPQAAKAKAKADEKEAKKAARKKGKADAMEKKSGGEAPSAAPAAASAAPAAKGMAGGKADGWSDFAAQAGARPQDAIATLNK